MCASRRMNVETGGGKSAEKFEQERQGKKSVQEPVWEPESGSWQEGNTELLKFPGFQKLLGPGSQMLPPVPGMPIPYQKLPALNPMPKQSIREPEGSLSPINPNIKGGQFYPDSWKSGDDEDFHGARKHQYVQDTIGRMETAVDRDMMIEKGRKNYGQEAPFSNASQYPRNDVEYMFYLQDSGKDFAMDWESMKGLFHSNNGDPQKYLYMTQAERDAYSYELARSPEAARNFLKNLDAALNYRVDAAGQERGREFGKEHPAAASLASAVGKSAAAIPLIS